MRGSAMLQLQAAPCGIYSPRCPPACTTLTIQMSGTLLSDSASSATTHCNDLSANSALCMCMHFNTVLSHRDACPAHALAAII